MLLNADNILYNIFQCLSNICFIELIDSQSVCI